MHVYQSGQNIHASVGPRDTRVAVVDALLYDAFANTERLMLSTAGRRIDDDNIVQSKCDGIWHQWRWQLERIPDCDACDGERASDQR